MKYNAKISQYCLLAMMCLCLGFSSCSNEDGSTPPATEQEPSKPLLGNKRAYIKAFIENGALKTALQDKGDGKYDVVWSTGDRVYATNRSSVTNTYVLTGGVGTTQGTFGSTGTFIDYGQKDWYYGIHVFYGITSSNNYETLEWPSQQEYKEANSITFAPMYATFSQLEGETPVFNFQNLGGLLRIQLRGNATIGRIKVTSDNPMAGEFTLSQATDDANKKKAVLSKNEERCKYSVTLNCGNGVKLDPTTYSKFYLALPEGQYTGVRFDFYDETDRLITYMRLNEFVTVNIERSKIFTSSINMGTPNNEVDLNIFDNSNNDGPHKVFFSKVNYGATYDNPIGTPQAWPGAGAPWTKILEGDWCVPDEVVMTRLFRNTMLAPQYWYKSAGETGSSWAWADDKANVNKEYTWKLRHAADGIQYVTVTSLFTGKYIDIPVTGQQSTPTVFWVLGNGQEENTGISFGFQSITAQNKSITTSISRTTAWYSGANPNLLYIRPVRRADTPETAVPTKDSKQYVSGGWSEIYPAQEFDTPNGSVCDNALRQK